MRRLRELGVVAACGALALGLVVLLARAAPEPKPAPFDARPLVRMKTNRPSVVLLGNSMVYTRFSAPLLNELVSPTRVEVIAIGGSKSAVWYAQIKHTVVASGVRPLRLVLFFRDRELTQLVNSDGDARRLARTVRSTDPVIDRKLAPRGDASFDVGRAFTGVAPVERLRARWWDRVDALATRFSVALVDGPPEKSRKSVINRLFEVDALRQDAEGAAPADRPITAQDFESSFLPDIFELARRHDIALTFARVRTRRHAAGNPDSRGTAKYLRRLRAYLERQGGTYLDLTKNEWESEDLYASGDHIAKKHRARYMRRFVQEYPELFRGPP